jgi:hypothetical protein
MKMTQNRKIPLAENLSETVINCQRTDAGPGIPPTGHPLPVKEKSAVRPRFILFTHLHLRRLQAPTTTPDPTRIFQMSLEVCSSSQRKHG